MGIRVRRLIAGQWRVEGPFILSMAQCWRSTIVWISWPRNAMNRRSTRKTWEKNRKKTRQVCLFLRSLNIDSRFTYSRYKDLLHTVFMSQVVCLVRPSGDHTNAGLLFLLARWLRSISFRSVGTECQTIIRSSIVLIIPGKSTILIVDGEMFEIIWMKETVDRQTFLPLRINDWARTCKKSMIIERWERLNVQFIEISQQLLDILQVNGRREQNRIDQRIVH